MYEPTVDRSFTVKVSGLEGKLAIPAGSQNTANVRADIEYRRERTVVRLSPETRARMGLGSMPTAEEDAKNIVEGMQSISGRLEFATLKSESGMSHLLRSVLGIAEPVSLDLGDFAGNAVITSASVENISGEVEGWVCKFQSFGEWKMPSLI